MNNRNYYRTPEYTLRCQDTGYDIGEPAGYEAGMRNRESMGQTPGMRNVEPVGYEGGMRDRESMGQMPGMRNVEPVGYEAGMRDRESMGQMPGMRNAEPMGYEGGMRNGESMGQMPGMRNTEPMGYEAGMGNRKPMKYEAGMRNMEPMRDMPERCNGRAAGCMPSRYVPQMEMQPEYGNMPWGTRPRNVDFGMQQPAAMPYYQMPGYPQTLWQEMESERDSWKLKEMYPDAAKEILPYVEEECDKMEYDGSVMFDEYPDRVMIGRIRNQIYDRVKDRFELPEEEDKDEVFAMNRETRRRYPPRKNWMGDLIDVLLFQEMHRRRCRHRNCRGWR